MGFSLLLVAVPLGAGSISVVQEQRLIAHTKPAAEAWAEDAGWEVNDVFVRRDTLHIVAIGPSPEPRVGELRRALRGEDLVDTEVEVTLLVGGSRSLTGAD